MIGFGDLVGWLLTGWFGLFVLWLFVGMPIVRRKDWHSVVLATLAVLWILTVLAGLVLWAVLHVRVV